MVPVSKPAEKEEITPMMQQTQNMVRQNLINQGHKPAAADLIMSMASLQLKGRDIHVPPRLRDAVSEARDMMAFMPQLIKKGYTTEEANEIVGRARTGFEMTGMNRIEGYDVSTVRERIEYVRSHPKEDYRAAIAGLMFKGPSKTPAVREKAAPPKTEVAAKEETLYLGGRLAMVPRKLEMKKTEPPPQFEMVFTAAEAFGPAPSAGKAEKVSTEYAYNIDIYGQKYNITLNRELKGDMKTGLLDVLQKNPGAVVSVKTPGGDEVTKNSRVGMNDYLAYVASEYRAFQDVLIVSAAEAPAEVAAKPPAERRGTKANYVYNVEMPFGGYTVTLNREVKGEDVKGGLLSILQNNPAAVVSIMTPSGDEINRNTSVGLNQYISYMVSEYRAFRDEVTVEKRA
ncbi:MAG: hypothetical protein PHF60_01600 [Candidatus ainarchaeum sp.]|nr:hypothetical protein [Candidatus ainarchaeum sp.]